MTDVFGNLLPEDPLDGAGITTITNENDEEEEVVINASPILCIACTPQGGQEIIPAVSYTFVSEKWAVFPLSRAEYGAVWTKKSQMSPWRACESELEWEDAKALFTTMVDYAAPFLYAALAVLKSLHYENGKPITVSSWSSSSKMDSCKISVNLKCTGCNTELKIAPRSMYGIAKDLTKFQCSDVRQKCKNSSLPTVKTNDIPDKLFSTCISFNDTVSADNPQVLGDRLETVRQGKHNDQDWETLPQVKKEAFLGRSNVSGGSIIPPRPSPSQFIAGTLVTEFNSPPPSSIVIAECKQCLDSHKWRELVMSLLKWNSRQRIQGFSGKTDVAAYHSWLTSLKKFFRIWQVTNSAVQAHLAITTFTDNAAMWWDAHIEAHPKIMITFEQLCEWIQRELVPLAEPTQSVLAWYQLRYRGDVEAYLRQLDELLLYYPLEPRTAHSLAVHSFGRDAVERVLAMDDARGLDGITIVQLKRQIRCFAHNEDIRRGNFNRKKFPPNQQTFNTGKTDFVPSPHTIANAVARFDNKGNFSEERQANRRQWCNVCGSTNHIWINCPDKSPKGCAKCGSTAHLIRTCPQRLFPPWVATPPDQQNNWKKTAESANSHHPFVTHPNNLPIKVANTASAFTASQNEKTAFVNCLVANTAMSTHFDQPKDEEKNDSATTSDDNELVVVKIPETAGTAPLQDPKKAGKLVYPIVLDGQRTSALYDSGASISVISWEWAQTRGFMIKALVDPIRIIEFSGQGPLLTGAVDVHRVELAGIARPWRFVAARSCPMPVVIGLDMDMKWGLCRSLVGQRLISMRPEPDEEVETAQSGNEAEQIEEEAMVLIDDAPRERKRNVSLPIFEAVCTSSDSIKVTTVTAASEQEKDSIQEFMQQQQPEVRQLITEFPQLFASPEAVPPVRDVVHSIRLKPNVVPVKRSPYLVGGEKLECLREQITELANFGWIRPSVSPWSAPPLFVRKKDSNALRMVVDFRDLNALTIDESVPMPRVETLLHRAGSAKLFSLLDLASGFHQIAVHPESVSLTAFCIPEPVLGTTLWEWLVMPFGLKNAPPTFQRAMMGALSGCESFVCIYLDDVLIFSDDFPTHLSHLRTVFHRLQCQSYHVRLSKCHLAQSEVPFLGHQLGIEGLCVAQPKVELLSSWNPPFKNRKQVRQFLGLAMWYKCFVPHLATIAVPLFDLLAKRTTFTWSELATESVKAIQSSVCEAPCLARWDVTLPTRVTTDASAVGLGAVLEQQHGEAWRPVSFWSRRLKDAETRYCTTDREWLAVVEAVTKRWKGFLESKSFTLRSDHSALARKLAKSAHDPPVTDRQSRWIESLMSFPFTFQYVKGPDNVVADALSRAPAINTITAVRSLMGGLMDMMRTAALLDLEYDALVKSAEDGVLEDGRCVEGGLIKEPTHEIWVPNNLPIRTFLLSEAHDSVIAGHFGESRTQSNLMLRWRWAGLAKDVIDYVRTCVVCQRVKHRNTKPPGLLSPIRASQVGEIITLDLVSKFEPAIITKHQQCIVITDKFSRFVFFEGCHLTLNAKQLARVFMKRVLPIFGIPVKVISDRGPQFTSSLWNEFFSMLGSRVALAAAHHPQTDGASERAIQNLIRLVRSYASAQKDKWEEMLPLFELAVNTSVHSATRFAPHEIVFGCLPRLPLDYVYSPTDVPTADSPPQPNELWVIEMRQRIQHIADIVIKNQDQTAAAQKRAYDRGRKELLFEPGDLVLVSTASHPAMTTSTKHQHKFIGPFVVHSKVHSNAYRILGLPPSVPKTQNVQFLKPFRPTLAKHRYRPDANFAEPHYVEGKVEWLVEAIVGHKHLRKGMKYRIKWADADQYQWMRETDLIHCLELIQQYHELHSLPLTPFLIEALAAANFDSESDVVPEPQHKQGADNGEIEASEQNHNLDSHTAENDKDKSISMSSVNKGEDSTLPATEQEQESESALYRLCPVVPGWRESVIGAPNDIQSSCVVARATDILGDSPRRDSRVETIAL